MIRDASVLNYRAGLAVAINASERVAANIFSFFEPSFGLIAGRKLMRRIVDCGWLHVNLANSHVSAGVMVCRFRVFFHRPNGLRGELIGSVFVSLTVAAR
jgi:hypothetical protein